MGVPHAPAEDNISEVGHQVASVSASSLLSAKSEPCCEHHTFPRTQTRANAPPRYSSSSAVTRQATGASRIELVSTSLGFTLQVKWLGERVGSFAQKVIFSWPCTEPQPQPASLASETVLGFLSQSSNLGFLSKSLKSIMQSWAGP